MGAHLFFYQLALIALVWLILTLYHACLSEHPPHQSPPPRLTRRRQHSTEPIPFAGLTTTPPCAACAQETMHPTAPPPGRPAPMSPTNRRPRQVDTSRHFCPHADGDYCGWLGWGNLRANGHPSGGPWRQCHCRSCAGYWVCPTFYPMGFFTGLCGS
jgi:hypothetical protein